MLTNVLTLRIDDASAAHFEALRQRHFPPERNQIPAHLTLFHTLPDRLDLVHVLDREAQAQQQFTLAVAGLRPLGGGVAYALASETLLALHSRLARAFAEDLTAQDRQRLQPHIVVQNKVTPSAARELLGHLKESFVPMEVQAVGLDLWNYLGGPWKLAQTFSFRERSTWGDVDPLREVSLP